jgi:hypothetical protein
MSTAHSRNTETQIGHSKDEILTKNTAFVALCHVVVQHILRGQYPWIDVRGHLLTPSIVNVAPCKQRTHTSKNVRRLIHNVVSDFVDPSRMCSQTVLSTLEESALIKVQCRRLSKGFLTDVRSTCSRSRLQQPLGAFTARAVVCVMLFRACPHQTCAGCCITLLKLVCPYLIASWRPTRLVDYCGREWIHSKPKHAALEEMGSEPRQCSNEEELLPSVAIREQMYKLALERTRSRYQKKYLY